MGLGGCGLGNWGKLRLVVVSTCLAGLFAVGLRGNWVEDGGEVREDIDLTKCEGSNSR